MWSVINGDLRSHQKIAVLVLLTELQVISLSCYATRRADDSQGLQARQAGVEDSRVMTVRAGEKLQPVIDRSKFGDTIVLEAGATFTGPLILPYKGPGTNTDADYITIRTSNLSGIPAEGVRVRPAEHAGSMPKILAPREGTAISTAPRAHHYRFVGVEFAPAPESDYLYNLVWLGSDYYKSLSEFPHHLVFDRCYVHSTGLGKARRGFGLNSGETWILNSHISGFAGDGDETQAIGGWAGPGPYHIINNYVEGGGQNIFFGGADPSVKDLVPSDVEVRGNYIYKPAEWFGRATIKASFEMKNVRRLVIDGNLIESGGRTSAFSFVVSNQGGTAPWSTVEDVEITNNIIRHAATAFNILGRGPADKPTLQGRRIRIANNLVLDVGTDYAGFFVQSSGADSVTVEHNTVEHTGNVMVIYGEPTTNLVFRNNIVQHNQYGVICEGGTRTCLSLGEFRGNIIADNYNSAASGYPLNGLFPPGNYFPPSFKHVKFVNYTRGDWRLAADSPFKGKATNGKDPGVNFQSLPASDEALRLGDTRSDKLKGR